MKRKKGLLEEEERKSKLWVDYFTYVALLLHKNIAGLVGCRKSAEDRLYELPEELKNIKGRKNRKEDMISNQMLSGIPEIDLGIEWVATRAPTMQTVDTLISCCFRAKIKNIEQTEDAKQRLLQEKNRKNESVSAFVPTNYAVNFVQHNRCMCWRHYPASQCAMYVYKACVCLGFS